MQTPLKTMTVKWVGIRPLIMHNGQLADPLNPFTKALKKLSSKRKKEDPDHEAMADTEWEGGLYYDSEAGPYIPNDNIESCIVAGAKKNKRGKDVRAAVLVADDIVKLDYKGPRDLGKLKADPDFRLRKGVKVGQARVIRTRPMFPTEWSITFTVEYDSTIISDEDLLVAMQQAGGLIGLGDNIPKFGRFYVEEI